MFPALALIRKVSAVLVVHFAAGDWRIKGADQAHILGATPQDVAVVLVESVDDTVLDLVDLTRG